MLVNISESKVCVHERFYVYICLLFVRDHFAVFSSRSGAALR